MESFWIGAMSLFAQSRRGRSLQKLIEGDVTAWSILIGVIVIMVGWSIFKARMRSD